LKRFRMTRVKRFKGVVVKFLSMAAARVVGMSGTGRRPTLKDIAAETGLSMAAVSYALRGLHGTPETRQRVQDAADRLGYQADPVARALASGRSGSIGVLCASLEDLWQQRVAAALGRELLAPDRNAWIIGRCVSASMPLRSAIRRSSCHTEICWSTKGKCTKWKCTKWKCTKWK